MIRILDALANATAAAVLVGAPAAWLVWFI